MEREEKKNIADIKKLAAEGQMKAVQIQAKELVRTRNYITKFLQMRAHLNAVLLKIQTVKSHEAVRDTWLNENSETWLKIESFADFLSFLVLGHPCCCPDGVGTERHYRCNGENEQTNEPSCDATNHDGVSNGRNES
jgi:hypothetical protein